MSDRTKPLRINPDDPPLRSDLIVMHMENAGHMRKTLYSSPPPPRLRLSPLLDAAVLIIAAILVLGLVAGLAGAP